MPSLYLRCYGRGSDSRFVKELLSNYLKGITWNVEGDIPRPKTEAERLNERDNPSGISWKGASKLYVTALRQWTSRDTLYTNAGWNKWEDKGQQPYEIVEMVKQNGKWIFKSNFGDDANFRPVYCDEIPTQ